MTSVALVDSFRRRRRSPKHKYFVNINLLIVIQHTTEVYEIIQASSQSTKVHMATSEKHCAHLYTTDASQYLPIFVALFVLTITW